MKNNGQAIFGIILFFVGIIIFVQYCTSSCTTQKLNYTFESDFSGYHTPLKLKANKRQAKKINKKLSPECPEILFKNSTLYIYYYHYICDTQSFNNGLIPNRVIRKYNKNE